MIGFDDRISSDNVAEPDTRRLATRPSNFCVCKWKEIKMIVARRHVLGAGLASSLCGRVAWSQPKTPTIKIGCLTDLSGNLRDASGQGSVACAQMAIDESGLNGHGIDIKLVVRDHQNKPDIGAGIAQQWFDQDDVDMIVDVPNSSVALAVASVARIKDKAYLNTGAGVGDLTGRLCSPNTVHWTYDTKMLANTAATVVPKSVADTWYFIAVDYAFGHSMVQDATSVIQARGGRVLGTAFYPFPGTTDFSSFLLRAQSSGSSVIAFANAGDDLINSLKQIIEFGVKQSGRTIVATLAFLQDIHAAGLEVAQGTTLSSPFYWDQTDRTRAFTKRLLARPGGAYPSMVQAGTYSATLHYLKAVAAMGPANAKASGSATVARMKAIPTDDDAFGPGSIGANGRKLHPAYLYSVKTPAESRSEWDLWKLVSTIPAEQAFAPIEAGACHF